MTTSFELPAGTESVMPQGPWSHEYAQEIALRDGIGPLSDEHWRVIDTLRNHFVQYGAMPPMRLACVVNHLDPHCVEQLFHNAREAWTVAGLPDPGEEARSYSL
jgi:tRNA 2-thiouridine synthesizing protein E